MDKLKERILKEGVAIGSDRINVDGFINHRIDTAFMDEIGQEFAKRFRDVQVDKILTVEASGIGIAVAAARYFGFAPVVFAKKSRTANISGEVYTSLVYSFTHDRENHIMVSKAYLPADEKILIVDDFLAHGSALNGLIAIAEDAGCEVVGCCAVIEKGFQMGGDNLRARGYRVESLAIIDQMDETGIVFRLQ